METDIKLTKISKCAGCGAKVGAGVLASMLSPELLDKVYKQMTSLNKYAAEFSLDGIFLVAKSAQVYRST